MKKGYTLIEILIVVVIVLILGYGLVGCRGGCTKKDSTITFLDQQGYKNIVVTGWRPFMADKNDIFSTGFRAINSNGKNVSGAVTEGWFKGKTIRFD